MTFLLAYLNVHYLILLSMVHEYAYFLWIHLENGLLLVHNVAVNTERDHRPPEMKKVMKLKTKKFRL